MTTAVTPAREAVAAAEDALRAAGCDTPRLDAELLVAAAARVSRERLHTDPDTPIDPVAARRAAEAIRRRARREPVAYILGRRGFRRLELAVDARVHDVGTGSGAVALAIKDERPDLAVTASDASAPAVEVARANAERLGLDVPVEHAAGLPPAAVGADLVVANLPYVTEGEWEGLEPEIVRYEPREALVSGADGLDAIRALVADAPAGARLALEHAPAQAEAVRALLRGAETMRDLAGRERVTVGLAP